MSDSSIIEVEEPVVTIEEEEPAVVEQEPIVIEEEPVHIEEEPVVAVVEEEKPAVVEDEPVVTIEEEPVVTIEEEEPAIVEDEPVVTIEEEPAVVEEEPIVVEEEPVAIEEEHVAIVEEEPVVAVVEEEPVVAVVEEEPVVAVVEEEPVVAVVEEPVVTIEEEPAVAEEEEQQSESVENIQMQPVESYNPPKLIFIVPYRDREEQKSTFISQMAHIMEDTDPSSYKIVFVHQCDTRSFNRGAMKNLGFLWVKNTYPNDYKRMTLVFQDVDTTPMKKGLFNYETVPGNVKHFFGYTFALGGIVSINGEDFEKINGFPNFWAWGYEDNTLHNRVLRAGFKEDRSVFFKVNDTENIKRETNGDIRTVNRTEFDRYVNEYRYQNSNDGISSLFSVEMNFDETTGLLNITQFETPIAEIKETNKEFNINNSRPFQPRRTGRMRMGGGMMW